MTGLPKVILMLLALVAAIALAGWALQRWYLSPRAAFREQIVQAEGTLANYHQAQLERRRVSSQLQAFADRSLGPNLETVDHRLRSRLNRLAEQSKLQGVSVSTEGAGKPRLSPARSKFRAASQRGLRDEIDFVELEASISGVGSLADVVRLVTLIEAEPWIKRIDFVRLDPRDNGARLSMTLRLTTLFMPGRAPRTEPDAPAPPDVQARFASLVNDNPFRVPPPPAPPPPKAEPKPDTPAAPPPPPPFPFGEWALTGIAQGPSGLEAWLLHRPSGATRVLGIGQQLDAAVFSGAMGEAAEFTQGGLRFIVAVGATMDQRTPTGQ